MVNSINYNCLHDLSGSVTPQKVNTTRKAGHICVSLCTQELNFLARWKHLAYLSCKWNKQKTNGPFEKCETQTHPLPLESSLLKSSVMYTDAQLALLDSHVFKHLRYSHKIPLSATFLDLNPRSEEIPPHPSSL